MRIKQDTFKFDMDKQAHFGVSFGLYYFFFTYTTDIFVSILFSVLVGLGFEIYQGYSKKHNGFSVADMIYNISGVIIAVILHIYVFKKGCIN